MRRICTIIIGLVFFASGLFKLIDPVGTSLIVRSYLEFFHVGFISGTSQLLGFGISLLEALTGLALLGGALRRLAAKTAIGMMAFFTVITLILTIANPQMDCGCFGEAIHLTNAQTFIKNLILCGLVAVAFIPLPKTSVFKSVFGVLGAITLCIGVYSNFFLPLWDFTDFVEGDRLYDTTRPFPSAKAAEPGFIYEKDGEQKEFSLDALPDSTWTFVRAGEVEAQKTPTNYIPVSAPDGSVCDSLLLSGKVMAVSVYDAEAMMPTNWTEAAHLLKSAAGKGIRPLLLAASAPETLEQMLETLPTEERLQLLMVAYCSDHKVLMTFNRSNGGAVLLDEGLIAEKWSAASLPSDNKMQEIATKEPGTLYAGASVPGRLYLSAFIILAIFLSLYTYRKKTL